jgi:hypothetical protein
VQTVDTGRAADDAFKLPATLRAQVDPDFTALTESDRAGISGT